MIIEENVLASSTKAAFAKVPSNSKLHLLLLLAHELTLCARNAYPALVPDSEAAKKLRVFNELQHTITGQLTHLLAGESDRYPDDVFIDILYEESRQADCEAELGCAFKRAFEYLRSVSG